MHRISLPSLCAAFILLTVICLAVPPVGAQPVNTNLLVDPSFDLPNVGEKVGSFGRTTGGGALPAPRHGTHYYYPRTTAATASVYQEVDQVAKGFDVHRLATGGGRADAAETRTRRIVNHTGGRIADFGMWSFLTQLAE